MQSSTSGSSGSTKGFLSNNSQSIIENSKGPSLSERIHTNLFYLATNIHRYKGFNTKWITFSALFKMIQNYDLFIMPNATEFWGKDKHAEIIMRIFTFPLHLCFAPSNATYHAILAIIFSLFLIFSIILTLIFLLRDPTEVSFTNREIYLISFIYAVIVPMFSTFTLSNFGAVLNHLVFMDHGGPLPTLGIVFAAIGTILMVPLNLLSLAFIRARPSIDMKTFNSTWGSRTNIYFLIDTLFNFVAFLEELLPLNRKYFLIGYCCVLIALCNPITVIIALFDGTFQRFTDAIYFCTQICCTMLGVLLMLLQMWVDKLTPPWFLVIIILGFIIFLAIFSFDIRLREHKIIRKLSTVYRFNHPVLPSLSPLIFTNPESVHVGFTSEAYSVLQAFDTLGLKSSVDFHRFVSIGTNARIPCVTNLDFIKWGLIHFNDYDTLVDTAQIAQYFGDTNQVLSVILTHIRDNPEKGFFKSFVINIVENMHTDSISDAPALFKMIESKAVAGLTRSKRMVSVFWGCVLNHSTPSMKEALCKMRDCITETESHFDELTRCYPYADSTINLMLSFFTEIKGYYDSAERYINKISSHFIEVTVDDAQEESKNNIDIIGDMLNNKSKSYYQFTSELSNYMEQERVANKTSQAPMVALWVLAIVSLLTIIVCFIFVIAKTLSTFQTYPKLLSIVEGCNEAITTLASLTIGARRMCLFSYGMINTTKKVKFGHGEADSSYFDNDTVLLPYMLNLVENLTTNLQKFYQETVYDDTMLAGLERRKTNFIFYGNKFNGSLSFALDLMANSIRNIIGNVPMLFDEQKMKHPFTLNDYLDNETVITNSEDSHVKRMQFFNLLHKKRLEAAKKIHPHHEYEEDDWEEKEIIVDHKPEIKIINGTFRNRKVLIHLDPLEMYKYSCQSACIKHLMLNIRPLADLLLRFFVDFENLGAVKVDQLSKILYWSMIILPIAFIVLFVTAVLLCAYFVIQESNFRTTLYLSLPEQIASEIFRAGGSTQKIAKAMSGKPESKDSKAESKQKEDDISPMEQLAKQGLAKSPEIELLKEKARNIESLHQFAQTTKGINGTGIYHFIWWSMVYIIFGALAMFALTYYARDINNGFYGRTVIIVESIMRFLRVLYCTVYSSEYFFQDSRIKLVNTSEIKLMSVRLLQGAENSHKILTYGNENFTFNFREYPEVSDLIMSNLTTDRRNTTAETVRSYGDLLYDGYKLMGFDTRLRIYMNFMYGLNYNFDKNLSSYSLNDEIWESFEHLFFGYIIKSTESTIHYYLDGVSGVISRSLIISLIISISALVVLLLIFLWPIKNALSALRDYFDLTLHIICTIPPAVFGRSIYIEKWIKGEINAFNYRQYEANFKRTVSASLQAQIIAESPEKLHIFNTKGEYIPIGENGSIPEDAKLQDVLEKIVDIESNQNLMMNIESAMQKIVEAKDSVENSSFKAISREGNPIKFTVRGIPTSETDLSSTNVIKYYAYVAILTRDITQEETGLESYKKQKDHTISLLSQTVPSPFAKRMHDGEKRIKFSAGIGSVLTCEIIDYEQTIMTLPSETIQKFLVELRETIQKLLETNKNISLIKISRGVITFVAGLFNDEQNGRTEALDSIRFTAMLSKSVKEIFQNENINAAMKFGISTGGPIYCKILMDITPFILISDETAAMSAAIAKIGKADSLLLERTTYECIYGVNIDAQIAGDMDFNSKHISLYAINIPDLINSMEQPQM